jgi:hypothetical protein
MPVSVNQISNPTIPHVTKIIQLSDKDNNRVKVTHKHYKDSDGKETIKDSLDINNPNGSDIKKFLNHLEYGYGQSPESDVFKKVLEHINGIEAGEVKTGLPENPVKDENSVKAETPKEATPKESANDFNNLKSPKQGMKVSNDELNEAVFAMRQDLQKEKQKSN